MGADRVPEQEMVPDDGGGASQSDTLIGAAAASDDNAARNDTRMSNTPMDPMDVAVTTTAVSRSDGEAGPSVECGLIPSPKYEPDNLLAVLGHAAAPIALRLAFVGHLVAGLKPDMFQTHLSGFQSPGRFHFLSRMYPD